MLPNNIVSEKVVLSCIIKSSSSDELNQVLEFGPELFFDDTHKAILSSITSLSGARPDKYSIHNDLKNNQQYLEFGGIRYLEEIIDISGVFDTHLKLLKESLFHRRFVETSSEVSSAIISGKPNSRKLLEEFESELALLKVKYADSQARLEPVQTTIQNVLKNVDFALNTTGKYLGLPSGFQKLDEMTLGFHATDLNLLAAKVSSGKSSFMGSIIYNILIKDPTKKLLIFSLEMSKEQLIQRLISCIGCIPLQSIRRGRLSDYEWARFIGAIKILNNSNVYIDDTPGINTNYLSARLKEFELRYGAPDLVCIDYLQLMHPLKSNGNRVNDVSSISNGLKAIAKKEKLPLLSLSQFSRAPEQRLDHEPKLSDLKDSSSLEADADSVLFIYREELYNPTVDNAGLAKIIVAKQRQGPTGSIFLGFVKEFTKFINTNY